MIRSFCIGVAVSLAAVCGLAVTRLADEGRDIAAGRIVRTFDLAPLETKPLIPDPRYQLGQALFFDPLLSGDGTVACSTCHLPSRSTTDGLPVSIGPGGSGLGPARKMVVDLPLMRRNAPDLWNRDHNDVVAMFWDGRVEATGEGKFLSPVGQSLPRGFDNLMAVQSVLPMTMPDEMLGPEDHNGSSLPIRNDLAKDTENLDAPGRWHLVTERVVSRLFGEAARAPNPTQQGYRELFAATAPDTRTVIPAAADLGNALSHYIELAFATRNSRWDIYLRGADTSMTPAEQRGMLIFFGKGRCSICHRGQLFSDFSFHAIGVPDRHNNGQVKDLGRFEVTGRTEDMHRFRTPPLRNALRTAPYFHNGSVTTLEEVVKLHVRPLTYANTYTDDGAHALKANQIEAISPILLVGDLNLDPGEIEDLIAFLAMLEGDGDSSPSAVVPNRVPSGLELQLE